MKYYTSTTQFNCGIDLHARQMYVCVMDRDGKKLVHTNIRNNDFNFFLKLVAPYRHDLTVCAECMFGWYWLADACQEAGLNFVLATRLPQGHSRRKNKNDRIDSERSRTCCAPTSSRGLRLSCRQTALRALLRQRILYVWRRSELLARIQSHHWPTTVQRCPDPLQRDPWEEKLLAQEDNRSASWPSKTIWR